MKVNTNDLTGPALDWAVAKCEGIDVVVSPLVKRVEFDSYVYAEYCNSHNAGQFHQFNPSTNWAQGGPIIERERIKVAPSLNGKWHGQIRYTKPHPLVSHDVLAGWTNQHGPTPLIAAMRCYVASKLGNEIEVPAEIL